MSRTLETANASPSAARTPLMRQYLASKDEHPDAFLFFRLGDFYEMFFDDAVRGAQLLGLTLTSRNKQDPDPIPMCGLPWHQRDAYVARLLRLGHKVAICDQLEEPAQAKGIVQRGVTEVLTPGSVTQDAFLDAANHNWLGAVWPDAARVGLCFADASTGEVRLVEAPWAEAGAIVQRVPAAEWLLPDGVEGLAADRLESLLAGLPGARSRAPSTRFGDASLVARRFGESRAAGFADLPLALAATAGALDYLDRTQGGAATQMSRIERWSEQATLRVDAATARHLELFTAQPGGDPRHTLWHHVQLTLTAPGTRRLRGWLERPLVSPDEIRLRQDAVAAWLASGGARASFRDGLRGLADLERLAARVAGERATPRELGALRDTLARLPELVRELAAGGVAFATACAALEVPVALRERLKRALVEEPPPSSREGAVVRSGYDVVRDELDDLAHSGKRWIAELEASERARANIPSLKVGYNRVFGYYLEVTNAHRERVPTDYERRQTLTHAERYVTPGLKARESEVLAAEDKLRAREHELFVELRRFAVEFVPALLAAGEMLGRLDAECALAEAASRYDWTRPVVEDSDRLRIVAGRHPVVERLLPRGEFVPNSLELDGASRQILLLTGPNMGGKSTYLRQTALIVLLAQCGSWVPADAAVIGVVDRLFTRVGAADRLGAGQSTFMVEMSETAEILRSATSRSLVLLDEIGRGTATYDGLALAWAVTEHLHAATRARPRTVFATHYHELTQLSATLFRLANVHVSAREWGEGVVFLHRIAEGPADRSYGIHVARLAGLPESVLARARTVLAELESERTVEHLDGGPAPRQGRRPASHAPLPLFETAPDPGSPTPARPVHPLVGELAALDPDAMTPLQALEKLAEWKRRFGA
ncbi:MAG TPA: DNA mismatch repair protein MutS [Candidatus Acidoferrales bacterium]|nr:DNA mismatch repair protein MutS [Candidatus Acidoferrales bacterium]